MSAFAPILAKMAGPLPPESDEQRRKREQREARNATHIGGIPRENFWRPKP